MEDPLLYDRELEDVIDFFNEKNKEQEKEKYTTTDFYCLGGDGGCPNNNTYSEWTKRVFASPWVNGANFVSLSTIMPNDFKLTFTNGFSPYDFHLAIYNRWGQVIWECHDVNGYWDGTYGVNKVQDGVYVWKLDYKLEDFPRRIKFGHVTILN